MYHSEKILATDPFNGQAHIKTILKKYLKKQKKSIHMFKHRETLLHDEMGFSSR